MLSGFTHTGRVVILFVIVCMHGIGYYYDISDTLVRVSRCSLMLLQCVNFTFLSCWAVGLELGAGDGAASLSRVQRSRVHRIFESFF